MTNRDRDLALIGLAALAIVGIIILAVTGNVAGAVVGTLSTLGGTALGRLSAPRPDPQPADQPPADPA